MSTLSDRMMWQSPVYPTKRHVANFANITEAPVMRIGIFPGYISYDDLEPLYTADGAGVTATGRGTWGQLYRAGKYGGR